MRDLVDVMNANVEARERSMAGAQPGADALAGTVRAVRRRRAARHTFQSVGAGAVVLALAGASWFGMRGHETPAPAHTPTPSVSPSPTTPTPTPSPTPSATAAPVVLDEIPGLPPTQALPPGLLEKTTPGWVLTIYRSTSPGPPDCLEPYCAELPGSLAHTLVLVSPAGDRYRVVDLPKDTALSLLHWEAGSSTAVVRIDWVGDVGPVLAARADLDLMTGALTPTDLGLGDADGGPFYWGLAADGAELWSVGVGSDGDPSDVYRRTDDGAVTPVGTIGFPALLDPTGRWLASAAEIGSHDRFALLDVVHGGRTELDYDMPERWCDLVGWVRADSLLATCADPEPDVDRPVAPNTALVRVDVSGGSTHASELKRYAADEPAPEKWSGVALVDGRAAFVTGERAVEGCSAGVSVWDGDWVAPLQDGGDQAFRLAVVGDAVYVEAAPTCHEASVSDLTAHDLASGSAVLLAPGPTPTADVPEWLVGLRTWVVAGSRLPTHR